MWAAIAAATASIASTGAAPPVRVKATLPGVNSTAPFEYVTGFLDAGVPPSGRGKMYFHYICAMAPDWRTKPLTIWYNGGPGAPSTYGLFQEFGPFLLSDASYDEQFKKTAQKHDLWYTPVRVPSQLRTFKQAQLNGVFAGKPEDGVVRCPVHLLGD